MALKERVERLLSGESGSEDDGRSQRGADEGARATADAERSPSHVCQSCGEEYFTRPAMQISTCRNCGGIKVTRA